MARSAQCGHGERNKREKEKVEEREWRGSKNASPHDGEGEESDRKRERVGERENRRGTNLSL